MPVGAVLVYALTVFSSIRFDNSSKVYIYIYLDLYLLYSMALN